MKLNKLPLLICVFSFCSLQTLSFASETCKQVLSAPTSPAEFEGLAAGYRGFLGSSPAYTLTTEMNAFNKNLITWWGQRVSTANTLESAQASDSAISNIGIKQIWVLTDDKITKENAAKFAGDHEQAQWVWFQDGQPVYLNKTQIQQLFSSNKLLSLSANQFDQPMIVYGGWAAPFRPGIFEYKDWEGSRTVKETRAFAKKRLDEGYKVTNNQRMLDSIHKLINQERQMAGKPQPVGSNRFTEASIPTLLEKYNAGHLMSVEISRPDGTLVGGLIATYSGALFHVESVFYETDQIKPDGKPVFDGIEYARMAMVVLHDALHEQGVDFTYAGMISNFSERLRGKLMDRSEWLKKVHSLDGKTVNLDLSTWKP